MTKLTSTPGWDDVPQLETSTLALGGPGGPMNSQAQALLNRTEALRARAVFVSDQRFAGGAKGDGIADDTAAIQAAINAVSAAGGGIVNLSGRHRFTSTLTMYGSVGLQGGNASQSDYRGGPAPFELIFDCNTTGAKAITVSQSNLKSGYVWGLYFGGFKLTGNNTPGQVGFDLLNVAVSTLEDFQVTGFDYGWEINQGMAITFNRPNSSKCNLASFRHGAAGITTTITYNEPVLRESPWGGIIESAFMPDGVTPKGNSIGTVFNSLLMESTTIGGINVHKSCSIEVNSPYLENCPDDRVTVNGTAFRLFKDGADVDPYRSVAVFSGGDLAGGNFGHFNGSTSIDIGSAKSVVITGTEFQRATYGIKWDSTTVDGAIRLNMPSFVSITNLYSGPAGKMSGCYPSDNLTVAHRNIISADQIGDAPINWTAALVPASGSITMGANTGSFTKIGKLGFLSGLFTVSAVSSPSGQLRLTGIPVPCANGFQSQVPVQINAWFLSGMTTESITAVLNYNTNYIEIDKFTNGSPANMAQHIAAGTQIHIAALYPIA